MTKEEEHLLARQQYLVERRADVEAIEAEIADQLERLVRPHLARRRIASTEARVTVSRSRVAIVDEPNVDDETHWKEQESVHVKVSVTIDDGLSGRSSR